jgi:hypothetical protein
MKALILALAAAMALPALAQSNAASDPAVEVDFTNPQQAIAHWVMTLRPDGSGHFRAERAPDAAATSRPTEAVAVDRRIRVSAAYAQRVFEMARRHREFREECESHLKVAFVGWKKLGYTGPEGQGSCTFNYSKDKEIQSLGDSLVSVADTILAGARMEVLLQHDRLGLDRETEALAAGANDGSFEQLGVIRPILERLAADESVLERVRKRARALLARAEP